jgi:hypothetical protein
VKRGKKERERPSSDAAYVGTHIAGWICLAFGWEKEEEGAAAALQLHIKDRGNWDARHFEHAVGGRTDGRTEDCV